MKPSLAIERLLSKYANVGDFVHDGIRFKTNVPRIAPQAYLHILFPPAQPAVLKQRAEELRIPPALCDFYSQWNGACLFAGVLAIYGLLPDQYRFNRSDWRCQLPFNLIAESRRWRTELDHRNLLCFGSYSQDRSPLCISRDSGAVTAFAADRLDRVRATWPDFEVFLAAELERLAAFFDEHGGCIFPGEALLPSQPVG
jgi:hypothetical protein